MQPPLFTSDPTSFGAPTPPSSQTVAQYQLNEDQMKAAQKVLHAQDYALILGMPGTGKSTTIAYIIHRLVMSGKSVLVTAYTHSAVDNLLMKLREFNTMFLRLGSKQQVHPSLHDRMLDEVQTSQSIAALEGSVCSSSFLQMRCNDCLHRIYWQR
jgi:DNA replication ATP-dependent helicase Dna2